MAKKVKTTTSTTLPTTTIPTKEDKKNVEGSVLKSKSKDDTHKKTKTIKKEVTNDIVVKEKEIKEQKDSESTDINSSGPSTVQTLFSELVEQSETFLKQQKKMTINLKKVFKSYNKECKDLKKASSKNKRKTTDGTKPKRAPSGFAKPTQISDVLCDFLGVDHGSLMARTEVTKRVTKYIKEAKLQVPANRRRFVPDPKLASILGKLDTNTKGKDGKTDSEKGYTYFNLQKYLSPQFIKTVKAV